MSATILDAIDLPAILASMTSFAPWIDQIFIFGSRRYPGNASYGSDIDLLVVPNRQESVHSLGVVSRAVHPYIDAFLKIDETALSAANGSHIHFASGRLIERLDAVLLWDRPRGWVAPDPTYETVQTIADHAPSFTVALPAQLAPTLILTAVQDELIALRNEFKANPVINLGHLPPHFTASVETRAGRRRDLVLMPTGMGNISSGVTVARALGFWRDSQLIVLLGIAGGIREKGLQLGDILVPAFVSDVESAKQFEGAEEFDGPIWEIPADLTKAIEMWRGAAEWSKKWALHVPEPTSREPIIHVGGAIASSSKVVADEMLARHYGVRHRKTVGIEMEALGVARAANLPRGSVPFLVIKSVSDWADKHKNDSWHDFCTRAVCDLVSSLIQEEVI